MIAFRADGSNSIGAGHIMRCLTIADAFPDKKDICFITCNEDSVSLINERGYEAYCLAAYSAKDVMETPINEELSELIGLIKKLNISFLMIDSYRVTDEYLKALKAVTKTGYIDDRTDRHISADLVLNYNLFADEKKQKELADSSAKVLCGADFVPIRQEFSETFYEVRKEVKNVLILTGGGDALGLGDKFAKFFAGDDSGITYHIVGPFYKDGSSEGANAGNIVRHAGIKDIWNLFKTCDVAITAGGSTVYELMCMGVPAIGYIFADNQKPLSDYIYTNEIFPSCGDYRIKKEELFRDVKKELENLCDVNVRKSISSKEKALITGSGAKRVKDEIEKCIS